MFLTFIIPATISILSIVGAFLAYRKEKEDDAEKLKKARELNGVYQKLQAQSDELKSKSNAIIDSLNKTVELQEELIKAQHKNEQLQSEITNQITGGDAQPFVSCFLPINSDVIGFDIMNQHQYPAMDVQVSITYIDLIKGLENKPPEERRQIITHATTNLNVGMVNPDNYKELFIYKLSKEIQEASFRVYVIWRRGHYTYFVSFKRDGETGRFKVDKEERN